MSFKVSFWVALACFVCFASFWGDLVQFKSSLGSFRLDLGRSGSFWFVLDQFRSPFG